jgi:phosphoglycerate dehydrogenase-like enzyme
MAVLGAATHDFLCSRERTPWFSHHEPLQRLVSDTSDCAHGGPANNPIHSETHRRSAAPALTDMGLPGGIDGRQAARFRARMWSFRCGDGTMATTSNEGEIVMVMRILWPNLPAQLVPVATEAVGPGFETDLHEKFEDVTDEQWADANAVVGACPPQYIDKLRNCRIFVKYGVGYDDVDIERFGKLGIPVCNVPDYGTREVADHAIALMMTLAKSVAYHDQELRADLKGNWRPAHNPFGRRLSVCTYGVVGMGRIGTAAARRAKAFDMDVVFYDPYQPNGYQFAIGVRRADSLAELMGQCDFVSIHTPLTAETRGLIGAEAFAAAKRGMILINTARGSVVDIDALYDAMKDGTVLAAGLDVLPEEPANAQRRLIAAWQNNEDWIRHRLLLTPHSAFYTPESMRDNRAFAARTAARFLRDGRLENCVNKQFLVAKG